MPERAHGGGELAAGSAAGPSGAAALARVRAEHRPRRRGHSPGGQDSAPSQGPTPAGALSEGQENRRGGGRDEVLPAPLPASFWSPLFSLR